MQLIWVNLLLSWRQMYSHTFMLVAEILLSFIAITTLLNQKVCEILFQSSACELCSLHFELVEELFLGCKNRRLFRTNPSRFFAHCVFLYFSPLHSGELYFLWFGTVKSSSTISSPCLLSMWKCYRWDVFTVKTLRRLGVAVTHRHGYIQ